MEIVNFDDLDSGFVLGRIDSTRKLFQFLVSSPYYFTVEVTDGARQVRMDRFNSYDFLAF